MIELSRYVFEALQKDEEFILYRGRSQIPPVKVLVLSPVAEYPTSKTLKWLEHVYSLREELDPSWATRPIAMGRHWDRTVLVLEDPGGVPLARLLGQPLDIAFSLRLAISLSAAIGHLHERGIIHKDIKPANVLVNSETGQCWLRGFGLASRLPRERQDPDPPESIAGTLAYMAPEQTGRMNRSIDSRSDLYALGVTLYEMVTGSLPFTAIDPMEWVHSHIARKPVAPSEWLANVPDPFSQIIMKLLAKTAEERYQTAAGLESDLRHCLAEFERGGRIDFFALGQHDAPDRLLIPEKLYGRASDIDTLLASFDRIVESGAPELVLVSGYSGIGKSSVVNELHRMLVPHRGLFASGKFDQYKRDIPYSTLVQAFQSLVRPLLGKSETELASWRYALVEALSPNGQLMVDLVPELKLIIGEQPPIPELPAPDAQRRFRSVFRRFIGVFSRPKHPLTLFLDDLQWVDTATLDLIGDLLTSDVAGQLSSDPAEQKLSRTSRPSARHLMLIGAYRDNEVDGAHPLLRKLEAIRKTGARVQEIVLAPLAREDLGRLIADSLHSKPDRITSLAQVVHEKTAGSPFFAIQFISALAEEGLLTFDHNEGQWRWDLNRIHSKGYTDNVVELMVEKLIRLPLETQKALQEFACLGSSTEISTLAIVRGTAKEKIHSDLWEAVRLELIVRFKASYKFIHDRVQEAAYSLIPEEERPAAHLRIGRLLVTHTPAEKREEAIFEIVNQFNRGAALVTSQEEREQLAELNLLAGDRAKAASAHVSALKYLAAGAKLLANDSWERRHKLAFTLELHRAECEFLAGEPIAAAVRLNALSSRALNTVELATVACLRVDLYTTLNDSDRAVRVGLEYLRHLGIEWSPHPPEDEARREYERIWIKLGSRGIEELIELPLMTDPASLATMDVLTKVLPPALFTDANLLSLAICRAVNLSLERGNSDGSCFAYVWLGVIAGPHFGDYKAGFRFGQLGYDLVEKRGLRRFQARTYVSFGNLVMPWTKHVKTCRDLLRREFEAANKIGDLTFAAYSRLDLNTNLLAAGDPLAEIQREAENGLEFARKAKFGLVVDRIIAQLGLIRTLRGLTQKFGSFDDGQFDELRFENHLSGDPALALPECWYWIRKLQARFFAGDFAAALDASLRAQRLLWTSPSCFETAEYHFYSAVSRAACCDSTTADQQREHFEALTLHHQQLQVWAANCPENFENRGALVGAEIARIEGHVVEAEDLYEQAIRSAHANGFVHNEAIANELAARFYASRGFETIANAYVRNAWRCYLRWGANGKARQLEEQYPRIREEAPAPPPVASIGAVVEHLDLATVIHVSQAVSGEIVLEKLIETLMVISVEYAGAVRGLLLLPRAEELRIEAEASTGHDAVQVCLRQAPATSAELPESVLRYVTRTHEAVILDDALTPNPFSTDEYLLQKRPRSVLCLPLLKQTRLAGVLYLENNLSPHVFNHARIAVLQILASQAAVSLENTRLYRDLGEREAKIRRLVDANIVGILIWNLAGEIIEANEAFLQMVGYSREDLLSGGLRWTDLTPGNWRDRDERAIAELQATGTFQPFEKEYFRKGGDSLPVLIGGAFFEGSKNEGVAFVLDLTERKRTEEELRRRETDLRKAQTELAYVTRVTTMGELAASIAHEVSQPIAGVITNSNSCLRWLAQMEQDSENLDEARNALQRIIRDGKRAGDVIARIRTLFKKAETPKEPLDLNEAIREVVDLTRSEMDKRRVRLRLDLATELPPILGDRVQLQQVMVNLIINAMEAMSIPEVYSRELVIGTGIRADTEILVTVRDSGPGLEPEKMEQVFAPFHTTKPGGLGMGLSISRSIVENHAGRLWASANDGPGATFQFTVPIQHR